ncbi:WxL domain-containing protein [Lactiplantibacillus songbeiensis]|uniref:WxL domain-containing protein n=1 Tax=Lactiplantibacillus songbeiensis TaxID=2559920 RepID=A0ABW4C3Q2_9LACO|nr:WxL domain-containing protein [Lactiplantibacillus songbeiensis]
MKKLAKQLLMMSATLSMGVSTCTMLVNAAGTDSNKDSPKPDIPGISTQATEAKVSLKTNPTATVTLDSAPTFTFEALEMQASGLNEAQATVNPEPIRVSNPGFEGGWTVSASISEFEKMTPTTRPESKKPATPAPAKEFLKGASVTLYRGAILGNSASELPTAPSQVTLTKDAQPVFAAKAKAGLGRSTLHYGNSDIRLSVPEGNRTGAYTAKVTWTMAMVPETAKPRQ